jgi:hypothetical protein
MSASLYILRCTDGSYYVGTTRGSLSESASQNTTLEPLTAIPPCDGR